MTNPDGHPPGQAPGLNPGRVLIVPSILAADFGRLAEQVREAAAAGADRFQIDVMDGHFVPNLTMGPLAVEAVRRATDLPLEVQLMVERPELFVPDVVKAGADFVQVHVESTLLLYRIVSSIVEAGARAGVAINPATSPELLAEILPWVSQINVMTVEPGFGGQPFIPLSPDKVRRVRALAPDVEIEVDGGIDMRTAPLVVASGANVLVAGSAIFGHRDGIAAGIAALRNAVAHS
jgi:ribulose-phosphate 3-epimerase